MVSRDDAALAAWEPAAGQPPDGTREGAWVAWAGWDGLLEPDLPSPGERVVVVSAHPDDDVLAVGGTLQRLGRRGCELVLVCASDGEASHPASPTTTPDALAVRRAGELAAAVGRLGLARSERVRLHLPDSRLGDHSTDIADRLAAYVVGAALVVAPWTGDGHPDHEACGWAAAAAGERLQRGGRPRLWEYPVWAWHWIAPASGALPWPHARGVRLTSNEQRAKAAAIECFGSQLRALSDHPADAAVLPADVLAHFTRPVEVVFQ